MACNGQVALVTGAGRGSAPASPAACTRPARASRCSTETKHRASHRRGARGLALEGDVCSPDQVARAIDLAESQLGPVSILVNNAGITGRTDSSWNLSLDEVRQVFDVNFMGPFLFCKALVPRLLERGYGRIVNVASIAGKEGNPTLLPYSASKAAVIALTKSLAKELAGKGDITVNAISPAVIKTAILDGVAPRTVEYMISKIPLGRTGTIEEVASLVHYLVSSEASFTTGQCYDISGGRATY